MHYGTTVLYCVVYFHLHFFPYPRKLNDNEKLWIYGMDNVGALSGGASMGRGEEKRGDQKSQLS